jgi:sugar phosphate isomerase/epimerase
VNPLYYETVQFAPSIVERRPALDHQLRAAAAAGFDGVVFDRGSVLAHVEDGGSLDGLSDLLGSLGIACGGLAAVHVGDAQSTREGVEQLLPLVRALRPRRVQAIFSVPAELAREPLAEAAARLGDEGVGIAAEFMPFSSLPDLASALRAIDGLDEVGLCLDSWHVTRSATTWEEVEALRPEQVAFVQFDDALPLESEDLMSETIHRRALPGEGELDLVRFRDVIRAIGYEGPVGVEVISAKLRALPIEEFARRVHESAAPFWHV